VAPEPSYLVGRYGEIENEIDNLDLEVGEIGMPSITSRREEEEEEGRRVI
jgi:hypothetical protein